MRLMAWRKTFDGSEPQRVNKWLAHEGVCSRREAEELIGQGVVRIDGEVVEDPGRKIEPGQTLEIDDASAPPSISIMLNKPVGFVSAQPEGAQVPAVRLLTRANLAPGAQAALPSKHARLAPLGRLDQDSRGLLILSDDGVLAKAVIGPHSQLDKEYVVLVEGHMTEDAIRLLRHGLSLDGRRLKPADVKRIGDQRLRFVLREGRKRQIRRMCEAVGLRVKDLLRVRIGPLELGDLPEGKWRPLADEDRVALIRASGY
jgi:23S rRNA pseudouridine2604 synthase